MTRDGGTATSKVVVEADVFSGVPNPTWTLDPESEERLATLVSDLRPAPDGTAPADPGLGFRGFVVRGLDLGSLSGSPGRAATLHVLGDDVVATAGDRQTLFTDPGHEIYTMLRDLAMDHVPSDIVTHIPAGGLQS